MFHKQKDFAFNREALRECMKCVVKVHLKNATNVVDKDVRFAKLFEVP